MIISFIALSKDNIHKRFDFFGEPFYLSVDTSGVKFNTKTLYKDHEVSFDNAIGEIIDFKFENKNIKVKVKFNDEVKESKDAYYKYKNNLSKSVSVGFGELKIKELEKINEIPHYEIYEGEIVELSAVWQGANKNAVIVKYNKGETMDKEFLKEKNDEAAKKEQSAEFSAEKERVSDISELAKVLGKEKEGLEAIESGKSYKEFSKDMAKQNANKKYETINFQTSNKKSGDFSLARILKNAVDPNVGLKAETDFSWKNGGFNLPNDYISKFADAKTTAQTAVGLIDTDLKTNALIEQLRQESELLYRASFIPSQGGNISIPRDNTNLKAEFVAEGESKDADSLVFDYVNLTPNTLTAPVIITRTMLNMSSIDLEAYAFRLIKDAIRKKLEEEILYGQGVVKGLFNTAEIPVITGYLQNPSLADTLKFSTYLDDVGLDTKNSVFFFRGSDLNTLKSTPKGESKEIYLLDGNDLQGYTALKNNLLKQGECVFGNFEDILIGTFGSLEVRALPQRGVNILLEGLYDVDMKLAKEKSFVISKGA
ncbi:phage major capsid protein [Campylobacter ureolyticus]|uniref:Phage major capsid protein n=1 Tax=Campylobacter ureolyticus TaxID=827 RepID=A0A9Q4KTE9_9BACT|nr:phage major capsid protein [Campylobacter ureolyticus]MCZ6104054.1 phage major capsid protein [Campylobacter ureolyticus]MCZ6135477.1 phage major capsid protein [Campylobacter ureolyticus]MCZ6162433.1 phage major capsid protein [Campylobacter ureolyticus]MCZ6171358.1 phage major capsid protein [Campylobacter ureolyticus]MDU4981538.1 phage major capsid protein [Campylobacter ureolyticus]